MNEIQPRNGGPARTAQAAPGAAARGAAPGRAGPQDDGREFQAALKRKRSGAAPAPDRRAQWRLHAGLQPQAGEAREWCMDDPLRGQAHVCTWKDPGAGGDGDGGDAGPDGDDGAAAGARPPDPAPPPAIAPARLAVPETARQQAQAEVDGAAVELMLSRMDLSPGARGEFELLLPAGRNIGVQYDVAPEVTHVLLQARSRSLSRQLQACAAGIGAEMSRRSGRRVEVLAGG
jgi:hypothetical protein